MASPEVRPEFESGEFQPWSFLVKNTHELGGYPLDYIQCPTAVLF
jgi:hypothetical protein